MAFLSAPMIAGAGDPLSDGKSSTGAEAFTWKDNQVHAAIDTQVKWSIVDVNDQFLIKSAADGAGTAVKFAVLDGTRKVYGNCGSGKDPKPGDPTTTWLQVSYSNAAPDGTRDFTVRRTADFFGLERVYRFKASGHDEVARLEPGISIEFENGVMIYQQTKGPIGTSVDTKALRLTYQLSDAYGEIRSSVEMDTKLWTVATQATDPNTLLYSVNNKAINPHIVGGNTDEQAPEIIADPEQGPGIGQEFLLKVSDQSPPNREIDGIETKDEQNQAALCQARGCSFDWECGVQSSDCMCHELSQGPFLGTCLI